MMHPYSDMTNSRSCACPTDQINGLYLRFWSRIAQLVTLTVMCTACQTTPQQETSTAYSTDESDCGSNAGFAYDMYSRCYQRGYQQRWCPSTDQYLKSLANDPSTRDMPSSTLATFSEICTTACNAGVRQEGLGLGSRAQFQRSYCEKSECRSGANLLYDSYRTCYKVGVDNLRCASEEQMLETLAKTPEVRELSGDTLSFMSKFCSKGCIAGVRGESLESRSDFVSAVCGN